MSYDNCLNNNKPFMPKLSVIVPIYNSAKYIKKCVQSLLNQSISEDVEYIFVNDCSSDDSIELLFEVLSKYPHASNKARIIELPENKGAAIARSVGLSVASGNYIAYCDSDDWIASNMYELLLNKAEETDADIVYSDFNMVYSDKLIEYKNLQAMSNRVKFLKTYMITGWTSLCNMIAKRSLYVNHRLDFPKNFTYCEDFYLSVKLIYFANKVEKVNNYLYYYNRENESSLLHNNKNQARIDELLCYSEMIDFFEAQGCKDDYIQELSWKILRCQQDWVLNPDLHQDFYARFPESHKYIWSCPFINIKMKIMMWMLTHRMRPIVLAFLRFRNIFSNVPE